MTTTWGCQLAESACPHTSTYIHTWTLLTKYHLNILFALECVTINTTPSMIPLLWRTTCWQKAHKSHHNVCVLAQVFRVCKDIWWVLTSHSHTSYYIYDKVRYTNTKDHFDKSTYTRTKKIFVIFCVEPWRWGRL